MEVDAAGSAGGSIRRSTRATVKSATLAAPARFRARAQAAAVDPVVITSSIRQNPLPLNPPRPPAPEGSRHIAAPLVLLSPACVAVARARPSAAITGTPRAARQAAGQQFRLVEPALPLPPPVQRHRHDGIETLFARQRVHQQVGQRIRQRADPAVLVQVDQLAQRAFVGAERIGRIKTAKAVAA